MFQACSFPLAIRSLPAKFLLSSRNFYSLSHACCFLFCTSLRISTKSSSVIPSFQFSHFFLSLASNLINSYYSDWFLSRFLLPPFALPATAGLSKSVRALDPGPLVSTMIDPNFPNVLLDIPSLFDSLASLAEAASPKRPSARPTPNYSKSSRVRTA